MTYNLPEGTNDQDIERATGACGSQRDQSSMDELIALHGKFEKLVAAFADACIACRYLPAKQDFEAIAESLGESFANPAADYLPELQGAGHDISYTPDDSDVTVTTEYERLVDSFRVKKLDYSGILFDGMRPCPTNPATLAAAGGDNE